MANYALDIENARVISAMQELGIAKEELIVRNFEDFANPHITAEIQSLRYEFHSKMLRKTVNDIRELLKMRHTTILPTDSKLKISNSIHEGAISQKNFSVDISKFPFKQRAILMNTLSCFEGEKSAKNQSMKPIRSEKDIPLSLSSKKNYKEIFNKYKSIQEQNLKQLKKQQFKSQIEESSKISKKMKEHMAREQQLEEQQKMKAKEQDDIYQRKREEINLRKLQQEEAMEDIIAEKLKKFENKIKKSEDLHNEAIKDIKEKALKLREVSEIVLKHQEENKKTNEVELLQKMVDKHENVRTARDRITERIQKLAQSKKEEFEKRRNEAIEKMRKAEELFYLNSKKAERKILAAQRNLSEWKFKQSKDQEIKNELRKLKDTECLIKVQRAKRRFDYKNIKNLNQQLKKYQKIDEFKNAREQEIYSTRQAAIKNMIEKEKLQEAVAIIWKSPRSRTAQEKLKSLNLYSKEVSISEVED